MARGAPGTTLREDTTMRTHARIPLLVATMASLPTAVLAQGHTHLTLETKRVADGGTGSFGAQRERPGGPARREHRELWGYGFFSPGLLVDANEVERLIHLGAGIEWRPLGSIGVGAEGSAGGVEEGAFAMLSGNGSYYFRDAPMDRSHSCRLSPVDIRGCSPGIHLNL